MGEGLKNVRGVDLRGSPYMLVSSVSLFWGPKGWRDCTSDWRAQVPPPHYTPEVNILILISYLIRSIIIVENCNLRCISGRHIHPCFVRITRQSHSNANIAPIAKPWPVKKHCKNYYTNTTWLEGKQGNLFSWGSGYGPITTKPLSPRSRRLRGDRPVASTEGK